jgi:hypothetical protein
MFIFPSNKVCKACGITNVSLFVGLLADFRPVICRTGISLSHCKFFVFSIEIDKVHRTDLNVVCTSQHTFHVEFKRYTTRLLHNFHHEVCHYITWFQFPLYEMSTTQDTRMPTITK